MNSHELTLDEVLEIVLLLHSVALRRLNYKKFVTVDHIIDKLMLRRS